MVMLYWFIISFLLTINSSFAFDTVAPYAYLIDYDTGDVLYEKGADYQQPPSSMSKLMTVYMVFDKLKKKEVEMSSIFHISKNSWEKQGSKMFVKIDSDVSVEDLLKGAIIQSGNDACIALAEGISGHEAEFANAMNKKAKEIGLVNSNFVNSTGWPEDNHLMTMKDITTLSKRLISDFPEYYHYFSQQEFVYNGIKQQNRNMLLYRNIGVDGLKTGHTDAAGYGLAFSAKRGNRRLVGAINGLSNTVARADDAQNLINYGFLNYSNVKLFNKDEVITKIPVWMGADYEVDAVSSNNLWKSLPNASIDNLKLIVEHDSHIIAPIKKGQIIGNLKIKLAEGKEINVDLTASKDIKKVSFFKRIYRNLASIF